MPPKHYANTVMSIHKQADTLRGNNNYISITWIAGHVNLTGNEIADKLAKTAALEASTQELGQSAKQTTIRSVKT